ncbi:F0F1 ATP synthase subunit B, partial [Enterobacter hormaechei]|nr:F0F1 ATP synthase subunit B [Enterobacter hormaechei]
AFVLFVMFCMKFVWPPIMAAIEKRQKEIADGLSSAERAKKDLDLAQANATDQMKKAKVEAQVIIEQANKQKAQILDDAKAEAEQERNRIVTQAQAEIDAERKRAREELRKQVAMLAIAGAEKIIERSVDEAANSDIVDKLVAEL